MCWQSVAASRVVLAGVFLSGGEEEEESWARVTNTCAGRLSSLSTADTHQHTESSVRGKEEMIAPLSTSNIQTAQISRTDYQFMLFQHPVVQQPASSICIQLFVKINKKNGPIWPFLFEVLYLAVFFFLSKCDQQSFKSQNRRTIKL